MIDRRTFGTALGAGVGAAALAGLTTGCATGTSDAGRALGGGPGQETPGEETTFGPLKQIKAGELNVGYVEQGPRRGPAVILMHGWPYDIHSYEKVAPLLAEQGYRVIVPYFRGHGTTRFLSGGTPRTAEQAAFALDIIALMDALGIDKAILGGFDWGSRTGDIIAALWPQRVKALVSVTGYLITNLAANKKPLPPKNEWAWWYQYYFATERGRLGLEQNRKDLARLIWKFNSPTWGFDEATFDRTASAFDNPDYVPIVIDNYRWRLSLSKSDPRYASVEQKLQASPVITVPTVTLDGALDPFTPPGNGSAYRDKFTGPYSHRTLKGIGHNVPQEAPQAFAQAVVDADSLSLKAEGSGK
ncbi:alpha/beta hydrolase [Streptomyces sp. NBC_01341]|uniref:alpha/beta fold hydrolase n=1 Tax=Streptomyces sp. NBC_01341 TaxID=2903831 RepID=UPI002E110ACE|nr:alpha/beta hydrolase [Streptomyces sp. NBC_01341]